MKMYVTTRCYRAKIEEVEVVRETEKSVWVEYTGFTGKKETRRSAKISTYESYFNTFKEAKKYLEDEAKKHLEQMENRVQGAKEDLKAVQNLKES